MAEKNIKKDGALVRGIIFALLTFTLGVGMVFWVMNPLPGTPLWADRIIATLVAVAVGLAIRRVLSEDDSTSNSAVLFWAAIWVIISYAISGLLIGPNPHSQLLETLGVKGGFWLVLSTVIIGWVITANGFTFISKSLVAWVEKTKSSAVIGGIILWCLAMLMTIVGALIYPSLGYRWFEIGGYWALTIVLTSLASELDRITFIE